MTARYICTSCGHLTPRSDDDTATGKQCRECIGGWASITTSPAGRYAAHRFEVELPEASAYCRFEIGPPIVGKPTGIPLIDNGGARICPNTADGDDHLCGFHRVGGTVKTRRLALIESLF